MSLFLKDLRHLLIDTVNLIYPPTDPNQSAAQATAKASSSSTAATTSSIDGLKDDASLTAAIDAASSYKHQQYRLMQKSGYLWKEGDVWKTWKCRYFVLSAQVLYYYVQREDTVAKGMILLDGCEVRESTRKPFAFEIYHQDDEKRRVYCLVASDEDAKQQWMKAIRNNIMYELNRNRCFLDEIDMWKAKAQELQETLDREHAQRQLESLNAESSVTKSAQPAAAAAPSSATSTSKEEASTPAASAPLDAVATTTNTPDDAQTSSTDAPHHRTTTSLYGSSLFDVPSGSAASLAVSSTAKSGPAPATAASLSRRTSQLDSTRRTSATLVSNANAASYRFNATPISVWQAKLGVLEQENELLRDENERLKAYVLHHPARADEQGGGAASSTISAAAPSSNVPASTSNESPATNSSASSSSLSSSSSSSSSSDLSTLSADELRSALTRAHEDCERYRNEVIMLKAQRKLLKQEVLRLTKEAGGGAAAGAAASS